jgi:amino acid transporter
MLWLQAASVGLISAIAIAVIAKHGWRPDLAQLTLEGVTPEKLRLGLVLAIFSSVGFESATSLGSEARDPLTSIPRAVKWSAILAGLFFFLCAYAEVLAFRGQSQSLGQSSAPLHVLAQQIGLPPIMGTLTDLGAVVTFFSCFLACITASARVLFLMGRHGALHSQLGEAHEDNQTPHRAVLLCSAAAFLPAAVMIFLGMNLFEIYGLIGTVSTFGFVTAYPGLRGGADFLALSGPIDATGHWHFRSGDSGDDSRATGQPLSGPRCAVLLLALCLCRTAAGWLRLVDDLDRAHAFACSSHPLRGSSQ